MNIQLDMREKNFKGLDTFGTLKLYSIYNKLKSLRSTVKPVLKGHSKYDKMVKSIEECSL